MGGISMAKTGKVCHVCGFDDWLCIDNPKEYIEINKMFLALNRSLMPPTKEYYEAMHAILKRIKKQMKNKRRGR